MAAFVENSKISLLWQAFVELLCKEWGVLQ